MSEQDNAACEFQVPQEQPGGRTPKKKVAKKEVVAVAGVRKWEEVVPKIREMKESGATVPEIAEKLELSYVLVNQVMLQSYKMSVDTIGVFDRQEQARVSALG